MVDVCGRGWEKGGLDNAAHCIARAAWLGPSPPEQWRGSGPVQLGGLAHPLPHPADHGWTTNLIDSPLTGCLSHFMVNGQVSLIHIFLFTNLAEMYSTGYLIKVLYLYNISNAI